MSRGYDAWEVSTYAFQSRRMITGGEGGFDEIGCILVMAGHSVGRRHADQRVEAGARPGARRRGGEGGIFGRRKSDDGRRRVEFRLHQQH